MYYIYKITNTKTGKMYIGYTKNFQRRKKSHLQAARLGYDNVLYRAMRKHGFDQFVFEVIFESEDKNYTQNVMEQKFISELNTMAPHGYNSTPGGAGGATRTGIPQSEETKRKISNSVSRGMTAERREEIRISAKNRKHSVTTRKKMSVIHKGKIWISNVQLEETKMIDPSFLSNYIEKNWVRGRHTFI